MGVAPVEPRSLRSSFHGELPRVADSVRRPRYRRGSPSGPSVVGDSRFAILSSLTDLPLSQPLPLHTYTGLSLLTTPPVPSQHFRTTASPALYLARSSSGISGVPRELSADTIGLRAAHWVLSVSGPLIDLQTVHLGYFELDHGRGVSVGDGWKSNNEYRVLH